MGEISDSLIDGTFDSVTGEYLGEGPGYPRMIKDGEIIPYTIESPRKKLDRTTKCRELNGILKFFNNYHYFKEEKDAYVFITNYCKNRLGFIGTLEECAGIIQKNYNHFFKYTKEQKK